MKGIYHWVFCGMVGLASCGPEPIFSDSEPVDSGGWQSDETIEFAWEVDDTLGIYDFFLDVRHDQTYPFSNLYLFLEFSFPNGRISRDTLGCDLADARGQWYGSGFGNLVDHRIGFHRETRFPLKGEYGLLIRHAMRKDPLPGIMDIGFRLESHPSE